MESSCCCIRSTSGAVSSRCASAATYSTSLRLIFIGFLLPGRKADSSTRRKFHRPTRRIMSASMSRLVLASSSPRRQELLRNAGFTFALGPSRIDEDNHPDADPIAHAERLAQLKAEEVAQRFAPEEDVVVLGADTVVVAEGTVLGKPRSPKEAAAMLEKLSGREHQVIPGVALLAPGGMRRAVA